MAGTWLELSKEIAQAVEQAGKSVVAVDGRSGHTSSGIVWRADSILTAALRRSVHRARAGSATAPR